MAKLSAAIIGFSASALITGLAGSQLIKKESIFSESDHDQNQVLGTCEQPFDINGVTHDIDSLLASQDPIIKVHNDQSLSITFGNREVIFPTECNKEDTEINSA